MVECPQLLLCCFLFCCFCYWAGTLNECEYLNDAQFYGATIDPSSSAAHCDVTLDETMLAYSHDDIANLGHSMSDFMNVWAMLWMSGLAPYSKAPPSFFLFLHLFFFFFHYFFTLSLVILLIFHSCVVFVCWCRDEKEIVFLNIDAIRQGHNYDDKLSQFARCGLWVWVWVGMLMFVCEVLLLVMT